VFVSRCKGSLVRAGGQAPNNHSVDRQNLFPLIVCDFVWALGVCEEVVGISKGRMSQDSLLSFIKQSHNKQNCGEEKIRSRSTISFSSSSFLSFLFLV